MRDEAREKAPAEAAHNKHADNQSSQEQARSLAARCAGDPAKFRAMLETLSQSARNAAIAEAHKLYGNQFVQKAMKDLHTGHTGVERPTGHGAIDPSKHQDRPDPIGETPAEKAAHNKALGGEHGTLAHPGDFDRSKALANLINPHVDGSGKGPPGTVSGIDLVNQAGHLPTNAEGKNVTTRQGNASTQGTGGPSSMAVPKTPDKPFGPKTEAQQKWSDMFERSKKDPPKEAPPQKGPPVDNTYTPPSTFIDKAIAEVFHLVVDEEAYFKPQPNAGGPRGMPDPTVDGSSGEHVPASIRTGGNKLPTVAEATAAQHRKFTMPGEGAPKAERQYADPREAFAEVQRQHTDGRIDQGPGDGTTTNVGAGSQPSAGSGIEQVDGNPHGPKHPDEG